MKHILLILLCCGILLGFTEDLPAKPKKEDPPQGQSKDKSQSKDKGPNKNASNDSERGLERQAGNASGGKDSAGAGAAYFYASNAFRLRTIYPDGALLLVSEVQAYDWNLEQYYDVQEKVTLAGLRPPSSGEPCQQEYADRLRQLAGANLLYPERENSVQTSDSTPSQVYLWTKDGLLINLQLIREGYAAALALNKYAYQPDFLAEQDIAQEQRRGIWSAEERCAATPLPLVYSSSSPVKADEKSGCKIKGLIGSDGKLKYCLSPGDRNYDAISLRSAKGERWFCSKEDARKAGWSCY